MARLFKHAQYFLSSFSLALLFTAFGSTLAHAAVSYVYDETDRLVEVLDGTGAGAVYQYDKASNLTGIRQVAAGDVAIAEFTPDQGPVGTTVTIYGLGFSATAASNTVKFNGVTAAVASATATTLVATVPAGATTGPISVTVGTKTATSLDPFTVTIGATNAPPIITNISPTIGTIGTPVAITGQNFEAVPADNQIRFNVTRTTATSGTLTNLNTTVPAGTTSGKVSVNTAFGKAVSSQDFFVVPTGYTAGQIGAASRITVDGPSLNINTGTAGNIAMVLFDGVQNQRLGLGITAATFTPAGSATVYIKTPSGQDLQSPQSISGPGNLDWTTPLPTTGTYTMLIVPTATSSLNATLTLSSDITATLIPNGAAATFSTARVGQNGRYTFTGVAGANMSLQLSGSTFLNSTPVQVFNPNGTNIVNGNPYFDGTNPSAPQQVDLRNLLAGTYTVFVSPSGASTGTLNVALRQDASGTLASGGAATAVNLLAGQNGIYTFTGAAGQGFGLGITGFSTTPANQNVSFTINKSDGTPLSGCNFNPSSGAANSCDLPVLPVAGTYTVTADPGTSAAAFSLLLSPDVTGTITKGGAALTFTSTRIGQNASYSYNGMAAQTISIVLSGSTCPGSTTIRVFDPSGTNIINGNVFYSSGAGTGTTINLNSLPATGTYRVFITPPDSATGTIQVAVP